MVESLLSSRAEREPWSEAGGELVDVNRRNESPKTTWWRFKMMSMEGYYYYDAFNDGDTDANDDELDQVEEEEKGEGYDGPPVEEDDDEGECTNAEKGICKEKWSKPE